MCIETAMLQGLTVGCLDCGGMVIDSDSGEYVPAEQVIHDPLHISKITDDDLSPVRTDALQSSGWSSFDNEMRMASEY